MEMNGKWEWRTTTRNDIGSVEYDYSTLTPDDPMQAGAMRAFETMTLAWKRTPAPCWDQTGTCNVKKIAWAPDSRNWPHYTPFYDTVYLPWNGVLSRGVTLHELGHAIMADIGDGGQPSNDCPSPHTHSMIEPRYCAWNEGVASWYATHVLERGTSSGFNADISTLAALDDAAELMTFTRWPGIEFGDRQESRVTSALWDIEDPAGEDHDRISGQFLKIWSAVQSGPLGSLSEFLSKLSLAGLGPSSELNETLYQNTIDYSGQFREDLRLNQPRSLGDIYDGGAHEIDIAPERATSTGHHYRVARPLSSPLNSRDLLVAARIKSGSFDGPMSVYNNPNTTSAHLIGGLPETPFAWTTTDFPLGPTYPRSQPSRFAAAVLPASDLSTFSYIEIPRTGSPGRRPGYDIEVTDVVPAPTSGALTFNLPAGTVARAVRVPVRAGVPIKVSMSQCRSYSEPTQRATVQYATLTMMSLNNAAASNRVAGWRIPTYSATRGWPRSSEATPVTGTSVQTRIPGTNGLTKVQYFESPVGFNGVLLVTLVGQSTASCLALSATSA